MPRYVLFRIAGVLLFLGANSALAGSLENLERERALTVEIILDAGLAVGDRQARLEVQQRRLIDLERLVLRDDALRGRDTAIVRQAFANYDLTFLAHAAAERDQSIVDLWLEQLGLTSGAVMAGTIRGR
jgi:hypothetical protein